MKNTNRSAFVANMIAKRKELGWSQYDLAERAGIHRNALQRIEAGFGSRDDTKQAIAKALGCTVNDLYADPEAKPSPSTDHVTISDLARSEERILSVLNSRLSQSNQENDQMAKLREENERLRFKVKSLLDRAALPDDLQERWARLSAWDKALILYIATDDLAYLHELNPKKQKQLLQALRTLGHVPS